MKRRCRVCKKMKLGNGQRTQGPNRTKRTSLCKECEKKGNVYSMVNNV